MYARENYVSKSEAAKFKSHIVSCVSEGCMELCRGVKQQNDKTVLDKLRIYIPERNCIFDVAVTNIFKNSNILTKILIGTCYMLISHKCHFNK